MSSSEARQPLSVGAWIAIALGGMLLLCLTLGCLGALFLGVSATRPAAHSATSPVAPAPSTPSNR